MPAGSMVRRFVQTAASFEPDGRYALRDAAIPRHIDPADAGAEVINLMGDRVRAELLRRIGLDDLLKPHITAPAL